MAPFLSGGGYCSEAISFMVSLRKGMTVAIDQHGDSYSPSFVQGLGQDTKAILSTLFNTRLDLQNTIAVCHSEPGAWAVPKPLYQTSICPPPAAAYSVGRTMFETDRITAGHVERCNMMDEAGISLIPPFGAAGFG